MSYANPYELIDRRLSAIEQVLQELRQQRINQSAPVDEVGGLTLAQQVTRLSAARIYTLVSRRLIPHKKRGNRLTFRRSELLDWLEEGNREQKEEVHA